MGNLVHGATQIQRINSLSAATTKASQPNKAFAQS